MKKLFIKKKGNKKMKNYLCLNGQKIEIPVDKLQEIRTALGVQEKFQIEERENGERIARIGKYEFLVLEQSGDTTALILKSLLNDSVVFGSSNNDYRDSKARKICQNFAKELESIVGAENLVEHTVDLTSEDGLKDYGFICEKVSILTTDLYRRYVEVLDLDRLDKWWWLATPHSTKRHENDSWVKCVSPRGLIDGDYCNYDLLGVRPFCILKSNIFVS